MTYQSPIDAVIFMVFLLLSSWFILSRIKDQPLKEKKRVEENKETPFIIVLQMNSILLLGSSSSTFSYFPIFPFFIYELFQPCFSFVTHFGETEKSKNIIIF